MTASRDAERGCLDSLEGGGEAGGWGCKWAAKDRRARMGGLSNLSPPLSLRRVLVSRAMSSEDAEPPGPAVAKDTVSSGGSGSPSPGDTLPWNLGKTQRCRRSGGGSGANGAVLDPAERAVVRIAGECGVRASGCGEIGEAAGSVACRPLARARSGHLLRPGMALHTCWGPSLGFPLGRGDAAEKGAIRLGPGLRLAHNGWLERSLAAAFGPGVWGAGSVRVGGQRVMDSALVPACRPCTTCVRPPRSPSLQAPVATAVLGPVWPGLSLPGRCVACSRGARPAHCGRWGGGTLGPDREPGGRSGDSARPRPRLARGASWVRGGAGPGRPFKRRAAGGQSGRRAGAACAPCAPALCPAPCAPRPPARMAAPQPPEEQDFIQAYEEVREKYKGRTRHAWPPWPRPLPGWPVPACDRGIRAGGALQRTPQPPGEPLGTPSSCP